MLLSGLRRLLVILAVLMAVTAAVSLVLGALARSNLGHAVADGFYIVGCAILLGSFVLGVRGPLRSEWGDPGDRPTRGVLPRRIRRTTPQERVEARRNSVGLFAVGILFILIGGAIDPTRRFF